MLLLLLLLLFYSWSWLAFGAALGLTSAQQKGQRIVTATVHATAVECRLELQSGLAAMRRSPATARGVRDGSRRPSGVPRGDERRIIGGLYIGQVNERSEMGSSRRRMWPCTTEGRAEAARERTTPHAD
ncbi:uncharacterized protein IWZ02DRAFT_299104 [Phyllosticta citriasiana]|uniref:uncharacterized protein n=1 Tax=Phyllosticta citriasiana TaxID=595635 RepID=UPI0030FD5D75